MGIYTASFWTLITSSATIPTFDENVYTLKANIDDLGHVLPGNPYQYPINITPPQNLYVIFTAPSGAVFTPYLCVSASFDVDIIGSQAVAMSLRSGSCEASGSFTNTLGGDIEVYYTVVDNQNNYYFEGPLVIPPSTDIGTELINIANPIVSITITAITNPAPNSYNIITCGACGVPDEVEFDEEYVVVQPASVTSSVFNAQIITSGSSGYGVKVSASVVGQLADVNTEISFSVGGDPVYHVN